MFVSSAAAGHSHLDRLPNIKARVPSNVNVIRWKKKKNLFFEIWSNVSHLRLEPCVDQRVACAVVADYHKFEEAKWVYRFGRGGSQNPFSIKLLFN